MASTGSESTAAASCKYYAVHRGRNPGVYVTWAECKPQVFGYKGARYKSFQSLENAQHFVETGTVQPRNVTPSKPPSPLVSTILTVYTDGACRGNGTPRARAGIGVFFGRSHPWNLSEPLPSHTLFEPPTNQRAEIWAIVRALQQLEAMGVPLDKRIDLHTDSCYCLRALTEWIPKWQRQTPAWTTVGGTPVLNRKLFEQMYGLASTRTPHLQLHHVRGHSGNPGNDAADELACKGIV